MSLGLGILPVEQIGQAGCSLPWSLPPNIWTGGQVVVSFSGGPTFPNWQMGCSEPRKGEREET